MSTVHLDTCWKRIGIWGDRSCPELARHTHCRNCEVFSVAAATLLDREPPSGYREEWAARIAERRQPELNGTKSIVIFRIGEEWLALPTAVFLEVADLRPIHSLPHRQNGAVKGLVNIRGELLVCLSLADLLGFGATEAKKQKSPGNGQRLLVVSHKGGRAVFPADEVHVGRRYHPAELKPVPTTVGLAASPYTIGLLQWEERNIGVMDEELLFYTFSRKLA